MTAKTCWCASKAYAPGRVPPLAPSYATVLKAVSTELRFTLSYT